MAKALPRAGRLALLLLLAACGGKEPQAPLPPPPAPVKNPAEIVWNQQTDGLRYRIEAAPDLNHEKGRPLAVTLCVYQLDDPSTFLSLARTSEGIDQLLDCQLDPAKARSSRAFDVQPGAKIDVTADRVEKARFLAVVAGYAHLKPDMCSASVPFPVHEATEGLIFRNKVYSAAKMQALIRLGPESVTISGAERVR